MLQSVRERKPRRG